MNTAHKQLNSLSIHYYVTGDNNAPCMLFLHPAFADHRAFDKQLEYFSQNYKVITIDLLGHGLSQNIATKDGIGNSSVYIKEIMSIENIDKIHLIGVSIGSLIAQDFANKYADKVLSLCALGGYDINNYDKSIESQQKGQQLSFVLKALFSINSFSKANSLVSAKTEEAQKDFYEMNKLFKRRSFRYMTTLSNIMNQYRTEVRDYPLLILCGDSDVPLSIELSRKWNASEQRSKFCMISNAGHCANMDNPTEFNRVLESFLLGDLV
jgi:pimeloyl-ACP methyl ester carboxylesterase